MIITGGGGKETYTKKIGDSFSGVVFKGPCTKITVKTMCNYAPNHLLYYIGLNNLSAASALKWCVLLQPLKYTVANNV